MLDVKGLVALWREGLGAQKALLYYEQGLKVGYQNHPQLDRFKAHHNPLTAMSFYLDVIYKNATARGYNFNRSLILDYKGEIEEIPVTHGQIKYEVKWLETKILERSPQEYHRLDTIFIHPLFIPVDGGIEPWERVKI